MRARIAKSVPRGMRVKIVPSVPLAGNPGHIGQSCSPPPLRTMAAISATSVYPTILGTTATVVRTAMMYRCALWNTTAVSRTAPLSKCRACTALFNGWKPWSMVFGPPTPSTTPTSLMSSPRPGSPSKTKELQNHRWRYCPTSTVSSAIIVALVWTTPWYWSRTVATTTASTPGKNNVLTPPFNPVPPTSTVWFRKIAEADAKGSSCPSTPTGWTRSTMWCAKRTATARTSWGIWGGDAPKGPVATNPTTGLVCASVNRNILVNCWPMVSKNTTSGHQLVIFARATTGLKRLPIPSVPEAKAPVCLLLAEQLWTVPVVCTKK